MGKTKEIQRRIKSVNNTKKITKAMEMVAAAKMRKSVEAVLKTRTYANLAWVTILNIAGSSELGKNLHPLLNVKSEAKKIAVVLISSNRGLCGSFNSNIINKAVSSIKKHGDIETDFIVVGKRVWRLIVAINIMFQRSLVRLIMFLRLKKLCPLLAYLLMIF